MDRGLRSSDKGRGNAPGRNTSILFFIFQLAKKRSVFFGINVLCRVRFVALDNSEFYLLERARKQHSSRTLRGTVCVDCFTIIKETVGKRRVAYHKCRRLRARRMSTLHIVIGRASFPGLYYSSEVFILESASFEYNCLENNYTISSEFVILFRSSFFLS